MKQTEPCVAGLVTTLSKGDIVLFIGAGLSIGAGLPSWCTLVRPLARSVGYQLPADNEFITAEHLLTAVQYYENQRSRNNLIQHLRDNLDTARVQPTPIHHLAASLSIQAIFTTNYDNLIELAFREANRRFNIIVSELELALWSEDRVQIVKLCGDLQRPESLIITKTDFNTYFATHPRLVERLRTTLESKTALFLGYSLQDPFFNQIWDHVGLDFGRLRRVGCAVLFDVSSLEAEDLWHRGIQVINLETQGRDRNALLAEWLEALVAEGKSSNEPKAWSSSPKTRPMSELDEVIERLRRIEDKLDKGRTEDRQAAAQILDALAQERVEQAQAAQMVSELRAWAQAVQQTGLPLNPELRAALDALSEHTGGAYQYLQLALPIIPGILSYNIELGSQHQANLRAIWGRIKTRLGRGSSKTAISVPLPESAWSEFQQRAERRGKAPEDYLALLIEMEIERNRTVHNWTVKPVLIDWPEQQIEIDAQTLDRLKSLGGAAPEHRISELIRDATKN